MMYHYIQIFDGEEYVFLRSQERMRPVRASGRERPKTAPERPVNRHGDSVIIVQ